MADYNVGQIYPNGTLNFADPELKGRLRSGDEILLNLRGKSADERYQAVLRVESVGVKPLLYLDSREISARGQLGAPLAYAGGLEMVNLRSGPDVSVQNGSVHLDGVVDSITVRRKSTFADLIPPLYETSRVVGF